MEKLRKKFSEIYFITSLKFITVDEIVDKMREDKMGVDEEGINLVNIKRILHSRDSNSR